MPHFAEQHPVGFCLSWHAFSSRRHVTNLNFKNKIVHETRKLTLCGQLALAAIIVDTREMGEGFMSERRQWQTVTGSPRHRGPTGAGPWVSHSSHHLPPPQRRLWEPATAFLHVFRDWYVHFLEPSQCLKLQKWTPAAAPNRPCSPEELSPARSSLSSAKPGPLHSLPPPGEPSWGSVILYLVQNNHYVWGRLISKIICLASIKRSNIAKYVSMTFWRIYHIAWVW